MLVPDMESSRAKVLPQEVQGDASLPYDLALIAHVYKKRKLTRTNWVSVHSPKRAA